MKEGGQSTHDQGEQVKVPLLPNKVEKRSWTKVTTDPHCKYYGSTLVQKYSKQDQKQLECLPILLQGT